MGFREDTRGDAGGDAGGMRRDWPGVRLGGCSARRCPRIEYDTMLASSTSVLTDCPRHQMVARGPLARRPANTLAVIDRLKSSLSMNGLKQLGVVLDRAGDDPADDLVVLDAGVGVVGGLPCVLEGAVRGDLGGDRLGGEFADAVAVVLGDVSDAVVERREDVRKPVQLGLRDVPPPVARHGLELGSSSGSRTFWTAGSRSGLELRVPGNRRAAGRNSPQGSGACSNGRRGGTRATPSRR